VKINWISFILGLIGLVLLQTLVLNEIRISQYVHPQVFILFLVALPINLKHWQGYLIGFGIGFLIDAFTSVPGIAAATCTLIMFLRHYYFHNFVDRELLDSGMRPSLINSKSSWYLGYLSIFALVFHFFFILIETFSFANFEDTLLKIVFSTASAVVLMLLIQFLFGFRKFVND
jgi:rod shape-determining protein MreD